MAGELVLIVEDNEKNLELVQDILEFRGFRTLAAMSGGDGIALAREQRPNLILLDIQLPDLDGLEVLQRIRADAGGESMPVLALTAFAMSGDEARFLAAGFDGYVAKPIDVRALPELIFRHCRKVDSPLR